ncbi:MAG: alpha/beta fold hydrolase [Candidatus Dormibacteria bacterium]
MSQETEHRAETPTAHLIDLGSGEPVVLLHGWGSRGELWGQVLTGLASTHRVVAPDLPGFGETDPPPVAWSVDDYVGWLQQLLDRVGVARADFICHSFGAQVAVRLATAHPARVGRLVLTGAAVIRHRPGAAQRLRVRTFKTGRALSRHRMVPGALRQPLEAWVQSRGSDDYRAAAGTVRESFVRVLNEDLSGELDQIRSSTLLIFGDADDATPLADARRLEAGIRDAGLVVFEGAGHFAYAEQPERFLRIVQHFLGAPAAVQEEGA